MSRAGEIADLVELAKRKGLNSLKYAKVVYDEKADAYRLKLVLVKPIAFSALAEIAAAAQAKGFEVELYAPHARAVRLDLKRRR
ncbi:MAG: hypothetical protein JZD41_00610 [Thermoproteus sp.]|nr:hypothetical protein [Thermoproteus sp.]